MERLRVVRHHVAVEHARENVHLHVFHPRGHAPIRVLHRWRSGVVLVAPDDADGLRHALELLQIVQHLRAVTGNAGIVSQTLGAEYRVGAAIAEAHRCGASVELRQLANFGQRICHVGFAGFYFFEARLRTARRAVVPARQWTRNRAPKKIGSRSDVAVRGELVRDGAYVAIDAVYRGSEHDRRSFSAAVGRHQIAIELAATTRTNLDVFAAWHIFSPSCAWRTNSCTVVT